MCVCVCGLSVEASSAAWEGVNNNEHFMMCVTNWGENLYMNVVIIILNFTCHRVRSSAEIYIGSICKMMANLLND